MSEERPPSAHYVEDLSVLSRRGTLSGVDRRAFAEAIDASPSLATAHQLGLDFDQIATVEPGDDALIAEVASRSVSRAHPRALGRWQARALLLVAVLGITGTATAWWRARRAPARASAATLVVPASSRASAPPRPRPTMDRAPAGEAPSAVTLRPLARPPSVLGSARPKAPESSLDAPSVRAFDSAEGLFREAHAARRAGALANARALYLRLERDFPASDEAHVAHVSLGNLLLSMGRAQEAEQQFASYAGGGSALAQEALVGRAQSLAALGRSAEERGAWERLLHDYPSSVYAVRAQSRLSELAAPR
jgi:TolA-binding protein